MNELINALSAKLLDTFNLFNPPDPIPEFDTFSPWYNSLDETQINHSFK